MSVVALMPKQKHNIIEFKNDWKLTSTVGKLFHRKQTHKTIAVVTTHSLGVRLSTESCARRISLKGSLQYKPEWEK